MPKAKPAGVVIKKGTDEYAKLKAKVDKAIREVREVVADTDQILAHSRQRLQKTAETLQHLHARRERDAERKPPLGVQPPPSRNSTESRASPRVVPVSEPAAHKNSTK